MTSCINIGRIKLHKTAMLAPMAGVADRAFRELCEEYGAAMTVSEMVSCKGLLCGAKNTRVLLEHSEGRIFAAQLFGDEPRAMAEAAQIALEYRPDIIDINMGCPTPKIVASGAGCVLMKDLKLAASIVAAVSDAVDIPVTVKMRKGWSEESTNVVELARLCEQSGAAAVTVHGRTRTQMYAPPVDYDIIKAVKEAVKIPVIANGDINSAEKARYVYDYTKADLVMIGRAALGNPFIFGEIAASFEGRPYTSPDLELRMGTLIRQVELAIRYKGERTAVMEARKHAAWYMRGLRGAARLRTLCCELNTLSDVKRLVEIAIAENNEP